MLHGVHKMISLYACSYLSVTNNCAYEFSDDGIIAKISMHNTLTLNIIKRN